jgi:hypothetical protein
LARTKIPSWNVCAKQVRPISIQFHGPDVMGIGVGVAMGIGVGVAMGNGPPGTTATNLAEFLVLF